MYLYMRGFGPDVASVVGPKKVFNILGDNALISQGNAIRTNHLLCVLIHIRNKGEVDTVNHV